jgi:hypothetical protein
MPSRGTQPRRFTYEFVDNTRCATENYDIYDFEGSRRGRSRRWVWIGNAPRVVASGPPSWRRDEDPRRLALVSLAPF